MSVSSTQYYSSEGNPESVGIYSSSGFDLMSLLAKVVSRPNPWVNLGPVDMSSALLVVDATQFDLPIIHATDSFEKLTGYNVHEIVGRNCRFLQSPDGIVERGAARKYVDNSVVYNLKRCVDTATECQFVNVNYKKGGQPFVNLITVVPIANDDRTAITYFVGFQVDLMDQSRAILRRLEGAPPRSLASLSRASAKYKIDASTDGQYFISSQNERYPNLQNQNSTGSGSGESQQTTPLLDLSSALFGADPPHITPDGLCIMDFARAPSSPPSLEQYPLDPESISALVSPVEYPLSSLQQQLAATIAMTLGQTPATVFAVPGFDDVEMFDAQRPMAEQIPIAIEAIAPIHVQASVQSDLRADRVAESLSDVAHARLAQSGPQRHTKHLTTKSRHQPPSPQKSAPTRNTHSPTAIATPSTRASTALSPTPTTTPPLHFDPEFLTDYHLVQNSTEFVHILSSRGIILFASPRASRDMLEFEAGELVGRNMGKYVHPGDFINLMRELKRCSTPTSSDPLGSTVSVAFRFRRKMSGYTWMDVTGHRYEMSNRKRTKCFVLTARERSFAPGPEVSAIGAHWGSSGSDAWWLRVSPEGFILHAAPPVPLNPESPPSLLCGFESTSIYGTLIYDLLSEDDRAAFSGAVERCTSDSGDSVELSLRMSAPGSGQSMRYKVEVYPGSPEPTPCVFVCIGSGECKMERSQRLQALERECDESVFGCIAPDKSTSMRYELNRLMMANKYLEEEIRAMDASMSS